MFVGVGAGVVLSRIASKYGMRFRAEGWSVACYIAARQTPVQAVAAAIW